MNLLLKFEQLNQRNSFIILILFFATLCSAWLAWHAHQHRPIKPLQGHYPNMFAKNMIATRIDENGAPLYRITSPSVLYYPDNNTIDFMSPHVWIYNTSQKPWEIQAFYARSSNNFEKILLWNNVRFHQTPGKFNSDNNMATDQLIIYPKRKFAETNADVTFWQPGNKISGTGLQADLNENWIRLLHHVRGYYLPSQK